MAKLVPELYCSDIERSLKFYTEVLGFTICYERRQERFAYLDREDAQIMLEQPTGRAWLAAEMSFPYGRGMSLQIETSDVDAVYFAVEAAAERIFLPLEEKWYLCDDAEHCSRQFIVQDPDGYLLRFFQDIGSRPRIR
ncbi:MAG TPA: VOC family protein [Capsulimonadaceae bacterium]|nr:VOC family protein [Capsulimonadaceae bacterium]